VHASAVVKAWKKGNRELMDLVYSAVPASMVGREQEIDVGPMSGKSNVIYWLEKRGIVATEHVIDRVFRKAKASPTTLTEEEILSAVYQ
jgi:2-isopropylmalate synthase